MNIIILGAGGHARVIGDTCKILGYNIVTFLDDNNSLHQDEILGVQVGGNLKQLDHFQNQCKNVIIGIGDNKTRYTLYYSLTHSEFNLPLLIHPTSFISNDTTIGEGTVVLPHCTVNTGVVLKEAVIINSGAIVEHDCKIGNAAHISPGAILAGGVKVGDFSWIGIGATVNEYLTIGKNCVIGANATVISDIPDNSVAVGSPAKIIKQRQLV